MGFFLVLCLDAAVSVWFVFLGNVEVVECVFCLDRGCQVSTGKMCLVQPVTHCRMRCFSSE